MKNGKMTKEEYKERIKNYERNTDIKLSLWGNIITGIFVAIVLVLIELITHLLTPVIGVVSVYAISVVILLAIFLYFFNLLRNK